MFLPYLTNVGNNSVLQMYTPEKERLIKNLATTATNMRPPL